MLKDKIENSRAKKKLRRDEEYARELVLAPGESELDYAGGTFANSIEELTPDQIELNETAVKKPRIPFSEVIRRFMFFFFLAMFIVSCTLLVQNIIAKRKANKIYDKLQDEFFSGGFSFDSSDFFSVEEGDIAGLEEDRESRGLLSVADRMSGLEDLYEEEEPVEADTTKYNVELEKMRAGLRSLAQINPDVYGWIMVEGTNINYPLVQGEDNDYYLDHAYTGDFLPVGSIFVDFRCNDSITKNYNTVIYGHNITTGEMFHDVTKFFKDDYFNDTYIYVYTLDGIFVYETFAIYETRSDYNYFKTSFKSADDFISYANELKENSQKQKDVKFTGRDRILTLSTCTNGAYYARYALHAKLVKTILD